MRILFHGYYGHQNTGDDAFIEVAAWGAKKYWGSYNPKFLTQILPKIQTNANGTGEKLFKGHQIIKSINSIISSDIFVCAGGSTFHSQVRIPNPKRFASIKKSVLPNFRLGAIGVSIGPFKSLQAEKDNIKLLKQFDFLTLRDSASYHQALNYNLPYTPIEAFDLAALLPTIYKNYYLKTEKFSKKKIFGISLCNYERYLQNCDIKNEQRRNKQIEDLLIRIAKSNSEIILRFFVFNGNPDVGDKNITDSVIEKIKSVSLVKIEIINYNPEVLSTWKKISECNLVLSTRLHAAIFACFANVPFFLVEYHKKCSDFLDSVGYNKKDRILDAFFNPNELALKLINILYNRDLFTIPSNINGSIKKSLLNFTSVDLSIEN